MRQSNLHLITSIGLKNLPLTGKLCAVRTADRKFKLGKLTFKFRTDTKIEEIKHFLEDFLSLDITTPVPDEYFEDVRIDFVTESTKIGEEVIDNFTGAVFYTKFGVVLKVGVEIPVIQWEEPHYVFRFYPQNLSITSDNFNLLELTNTV